MEELRVEEDRSQDSLVRHVGVQSMDIHHPPFPFPFFPPNFQNYQNVCGSSVGFGVGLGARESFDRMDAPTEP